ncbi:hypothetical protein [Bartonella tribocorum]|nr:hypothetical protein [Bartonella tribocorum]
MSRCCSSTKSKRLSQVSALSTPGIPTRGRSQPVGGVTRES